MLECKIVEQCGLLSGEILGEFFIFNPKYFVKIQSLTAKVVNLSDQSIEEFTFDGEIQSLVNNVKTEGGNDRGNITPTLIGRLLFYPVIYKLGSDGKTDWLNHLPLILYEAFLEEVRTGVGFFLLFKFCKLQIYTGVRLVGR